MKRKIWTVTVVPLGAVLNYPWENNLLKGKSVTVEMEATSMGKINRRKIDRMGIVECQKQFGHLCKIGTWSISYPKEKEVSK